MNIDLFLYIAALVFFLLSGFNVPKANWMCFGFAALTASLIF